MKEQSLPMEKIWQDIVMLYYTISVGRLQFVLIIKNI